jgi:hypothetical protein
MFYIFCGLRFMFFTFFILLSLFSFALSLSFPVILETCFSLSPYLDLFLLSLYSSSVYFSRISLSTLSLTFSSVFYLSFFRSLLVFSVLALSSFLSFLLHFFRLFFHVLPHFTVYFFVRVKELLSLLLLIYPSCWIRLCRC